MYTNDKYSPQGSGIYNRVADQKVGTCCDGVITVTGDTVSARLLRNGRLVIVAHIGMSPQVLSLMRRSCFTPRNIL
jgi:hypothetical protein